MIRTSIIFSLLFFVPTLGSVGSYLGARTSRLHVGGDVSHVAVGADASKRQDIEADTATTPSPLGGIKGGLQRLKQYLDDRVIKKVDTTYLALPKYGWRASVTTNFAGINATVKGRNIPTYQDINVNMHSGMNGNVALQLGYRGLSAKYSFDLTHGYSRDFNLSMLSRVFGVEYRDHTTDGLHGTLDASVTPDNLPVRKDDTRLHATVINGYYVFNFRKYSLPAAMKQSLIQKRSAGSLTAYAVFLSSKLEPKNATLSAALGGLKKIEIYQAAAGLGYGYNYTPNQGRLLAHLSAAPLLVFFNKSFLTASTSIPLPDGTTYTTDISREVKPKHRFFVTGVARASVFYNFSPHLYAGISALLNDIGYSSATGVDLHMDDWITNATLGFRF